MSTSNNAVCKPINKKLAFKAKISDVAREENPHKSYVVFVKVVSKFPDGVYMVADETGVMKLVVDPKHEQQNLNIGCVYQLIRVKFVYQIQITEDGRTEAPGSAGILVMRPGSYLLELADMTFPNIPVLHREFTSRQLQEQNEHDRINVRVPMIFLLDGVGKIKKSLTKNVIFRHSYFKDEHNIVKMSGFDNDVVNKFDSWNVGKIYKIEDFNTNRYTDKAGITQINMTYIRGKTKVTEMIEGGNYTEYEKKRMEILSKLKSQFTGILINYTQPNYWNACSYCGKSVDTDAPKQFVLDIGQSQTSSTTPKCDCGLLIDSDMKIERKFNTKLIFDDVEIESCHAVVTFSDQLAEIRDTLNLNNVNDAEFLRQLTGTTAKVIFEERRTKNGNKPQVVMKDMFLVIGKDGEHGSECLDMDEREFIEEGEVVGEEEEEMRIVAEGPILMMTKTSSIPPTPLTTKYTDRSKMESSGSAPMIEDGAEIKGGNAEFLREKRKRKVAKKSPYSEGESSEKKAK